MSKVPFTHSEQHRHECEVRYLCQKRARQGNGSGVDTYLANIAKKRGEEAKSKLNFDYQTQWMHGNKGERGLWLVVPEKAELF